MLRRLGIYLTHAVLLLAVMCPTAWGQTEGQLINGNRTHAGATNYGVTTGSTNAYVLTLNKPIPDYAEGSCYWLELHAANTGAATLNVDGNGAKNIVKYVFGAATPLAANDFSVGQVVEVCYDGVNMQAQLGGGGGGHIIHDEGTPLPQRPNLNIVGAGAVCDTQDASTTRCTVTGGGGGGSLILDLADNGTNESAALVEIATVGDTNGIFTESSADKLLINVGLDWPKADLADAATALAGITTNCPPGQLAGGISNTGVAEDCTDIVTQGELNTHIGTTSAVHGSTASNTPSTLVQRDASGNFAANTITATAFVGLASQATAFPSNPANCTNATDLAAGITATGVAEGCVDVATQVELNAHATTTSAVHGSTASNTPSTLVQRDASGNFAATIITATTFSGNATTASGFDANPANCTNATDLAAGVNALGVAEGCIDVATQAELNTHAGLTTAVHGSTANNTPNTLVQRDASGNFSATTITATAFVGLASQASAFPSNPANCTNATDLAAGITAAGVAEGCVDVATQAELNAHAAVTTAVHGSTAANTPSTLVQRDASGNFAATTITATTLSGNATTATALANNGLNCDPGEAAAGVDTLGNAEGCITVGGGGGTPVVVDLADDGSNESSDLAEIATVGDTNSIFSVAGGNKLIINLGLDWPKADTADALAANPANCTNATDLAAGITAAGVAEGCIDVATQVELNAHTGTTTAVHGSTASNTPSTLVQRDASGNFAAATITATNFTGLASQASAFPSNPANCTNATDLAAGITATGVAEGCIDVATQVELDAHAALNNPHGATTANTGSRIVLRDPSGNFTAGTITASFVGPVTGNASTATALANNGQDCNPGEAARGVDTLGNAEGCTSIAGGGGTSVALDLGDNGSNESAALAEIATVNDGPGIFSLGAANKLLINVGLAWPTATAFPSNPANCTNATDLAAGITATGIAEGCVDVATQVELDAHAALNNPHNATALNTFSRIVLRDASGNFAATTITAALAGNATTASALQNDPLNCDPGNAPLGILASGVAEGCFDVATQTELTAGLATKVSVSGTPSGAGPSPQVAEWVNATTVQGVATVGTGNVVRQTNASLNTPNLGIPTAIDLQNATNLPVAAIPKVIRAAMAVSLARMGGF